MKILLASIAGRAGSGAMHGLVDEYVSRLVPYTPIETRTFRSESAFLEDLGKIGGRTTPLLALLDSRGKALSSEAFSGWLGRQRDGGIQTLVFAVGPADGWSRSALAKAGLVLSLGPMTLPHELARVVLAEQVYRAFTILANHPYHGGH